MNSLKFWRGDKMSELFKIPVQLTLSDLSYLEHGRDLHITLDGPTVKETKVVVLHSPIDGVFITGEDLWKLRKFAAQDQANDSDIIDKILKEVRIKK